MGKVKDREFWESASMNNTLFLLYYNRLVELAVSMFEWKNIPDSIDPRYLELCLFSEGKAIWFRDDVLGDLALRCAINGGFDVYRVPINRRAYAINGYNKTLTDKDSVIIWNNYLRTNSMPMVEAYAKRLYNLDRIIDINANAQKTPLFIRCDENQLLTMKNMYMKYDGSIPVIYADNNVSANPIQVLQTNAPYLADKLEILKTQLWNEALTYLGISNTNTMKRERLVSEEITRNEGGTLANRYSRLIARQEACDKINKMFGLDISVDFREDVRYNTEMVGNEYLGGVDHEPLHDRS